ncbi:MAG TPA: hypothetical protein ENN22_16225 [bacterium]|nr:hypothetical protein [bacterium]
MPLEIIIPGLIVAGFLLILVEIFLVPGFNVFGIFGFVIVVLGIIFAYTKLETRIANLILIVSIILAVVVIMVVTKSKSWKRMVLATDQQRTAGFHSSAEHLISLLGKRGVTKTTLRPAGMALFDDEKVDVVAEGSFIDSGKPVEVIFVEGNRVVVKEIKSDEMDID